MRKGKHFLELRDYFDNGAGVNGRLRSAIKDILFEDLAQLGEKPSDKYFHDYILRFDDSDTMLLIYEYVSKSLMITYLYAAESENLLGALRFIENEDTVEISKAFVDKDARNCGVLKLMLEYVEAGYSQDYAIKISLKPEEGRLLAENEKQALDQESINRCIAEEIGYKIDGDFAVLDEKV